MRQIDRWEQKKRQRKGQTTLESLDSKEVRRIVEEYLSTRPAMLPPAIEVNELNILDSVNMPGDDDRSPEQTIVYERYGYRNEIIRYVEDGHGIPPQWTEHDDLLPDGNVPAAVVEAEAVGGKSFIQLKWTPVSHPHRFDYNVHISASASFTADDSNLVCTTMGSQVWIRGLTDGTPLQYGTTYYMQIVSTDADGDAAPSPEVSAALDENASEDLTVGSITAEQLEAALVLATTIIAGNASPGSRLEFGVTTDGNAVGMYAYDGENVLTFSIDASTGQVYIRGTVDFGQNFIDSGDTASRLTDDNIIEILRQEEGFTTPYIVRQVHSSGTTSGENATLSIGVAGLPGSKYALMLTIVDPDGTPPDPDNPSGWGSQLVDETEDDSRTFMWTRETSPGAGTITVACNDTNLEYSLTYIEIAGVDLSGTDIVISYDNTDDVVYTGNSGTLNQAAGFAVAYFFARATEGGVNGADANLDEDSLTGGFQFPTGYGWGGSGGDFANLTYTAELVTTATTAIESTMDYLDVVASPNIGMLAWFPAKAAGALPPDANRVRLYARDMDGEAKLFEVTSEDYHSQVGGPTGAIVAFGGGGAPDGWLMCEGASVLRADYPALFGVIGTTYGSADGTHFTLPDLQARFPLGYKSGDTPAGTMAATGGSKVPALLAHTHGPGSYVVHHTNNNNTTTGGANNRVTAMIDSGGTNSDVTGDSGSASDGSQTVGNLPPYQVVRFIIKT